MGVFTAEVVDEVLERSGGACEALISSVCVGTGQAFHHRKLRRHGDHSAANCLHVCRPCHDFIHANVEVAYGVGLLVHSWDDPAAVAVAR